MTPLTPEAKKALSARVQFYRDLGIHSFYRRSEAPVAEAHTPEVESTMAKSSSAAKPAPVKVKSLPVLNDLSKTAALDAIRADIGDCTRCRLSKERNQIVFGTGNMDADIMFVGEGPGADEDEQGLPFVGRGGQLLNNMINAMGIKREDVYIANVVKCRPPGNRTPERDECDTCSPFLMQQIEVVKPKIIVALGAVAAKNLLGLNDSMANLRGQIYDFKNTNLAVTYHPAYLLRDPRQKAEAWKDLQMVMKHLGMKVPAGPKNG
ncbi:MAG: phage polymerase-related protein [Acidobacteriales bacterium]|nr:phage polymerase-related protein [Terriglobales bacterium]